MAKLALLTNKVRLNEKGEELIFQSKPASNLIGVRYTYVNKVTKELDHRDFAFNKIPVLYLKKYGSLPAYESNYIVENKCNKKLTISICNNNDQQLSVTVKYSYVSKDSITASTTITDAKLVNQCIDALLIHTANIHGTADDISASFIQLEQMGFKPFTSHLINYYITIHPMYEEIFKVAKEGSVEEYAAILNKYNILNISKYKLAAVLHAQNAESPNHSTMLIKSNNILVSNGIETINDLMNFGFSKLNTIPNLGPKLQSLIINEFKPFINYYK